MKQRKLLITGASGFTGRHACTYFSMKGVNVVAVVRSKGEVPLHPCVEERVCDLNDKEQVQKLISEVSPDEVLHLAGKNSVPESWKQPILYMEVNVLATLYILDALRVCPKSRILVVGSRLTFDFDSSPQPLHPYSLSKTLEVLAVQSWMSLFKQNIVLAEPSNLIGPGLSTGICSLFAQHIVAVERGLTNAAFRLTSADDTRDFLDVRDAICAYDKLLTLGEAGTIYPICSGVERTLESVAESMMSMSDISIPLEFGKKTNPQGNKLSSSPVLLKQLGWTTGRSIHESLYDIIQYYRNEEWASNDT